MRTIPETHFHVRWPDGQVTKCYSPSSTVRNYFSPGDDLTVEAMVVKSKKALAHASERVRDKFGFRCLRAAEQLQEILEIARGFAAADTVRIEDVTQVNDP